MAASAYACCPYLPLLLCLCLCVQKLTGSADGLLAAQRSPSTPLQRLAAHHKEVAELVRAEQDRTQQGKRARAGREGGGEGRGQGRGCAVSYTAVLLHDRHLNS